MDFSKTRKSPILLQEVNRKYAYLLSLDFEWGNNL